MRLSGTITVSAPPERVWGVIADPESVLSFMSGVTRWEVVSEDPTGIGARFRMLLRVRSAEIGGLIEVVEWVPGRELAWTSVTGLDQRGRWRLREAGADRTRVEFRLAYGVAGAGLTGWLAEHIAAPTVNGHLHRSLRELKRIVEHQQLRERAAARQNRQSAA